jgi:hypothetical protein
MPDKSALAAAFYSPVEAELARGLLEEEGIKTFLTGGGSVNIFSGVQGLGGQIQVRVSEADADRAVQLLAPHFDHHQDEADASAEADSALWVCPLCGDAVCNDLEFCPSCKTERPAVRPSLAVTTAPRFNAASQDIKEEPVLRAEKLTPDPPLESEPARLEGDLDVPDMETLVGDDLVRRAFFSSLFGFLSPYSLWLLLRLAFYSGKVSPMLMPKLYGAILIDAGWLLLILALLARVFTSVYPFI